ncbi:hypothetical protein JKF63_06655 [Porcisia hertigi]|uniref:Calponin-homology (CH) domain-containing protein n=1 Tax=Porcisia hertigi TaxID=2761500 RepID=A0A836LH34_9TRYP|nr:hypothetical protein JKF63_06655 [Porcisia hertigi]
MSSTSALWRSSKVSHAPKVTKFSTVKKLPVAEQSASSLAAAAAAASTNSRESRHSRPSSPGADTFCDTVYELYEEQRRLDDERTTDRRIRRHRYAQFVERLNAQRSLHQSTAVFVETMLKELQHSAEAGIAMKAAAATWGLKLLAKNASHNAIHTVLEFLLPALYCEYNPEKLRGASPAVQLQVREEDALIDNPYFTHTMFADEVHVEKRCAAHILESLEAAVRANDKRRRMVCRLVERQRWAHLQVAFRGWRHHVRKERLLRLLGDNTAKKRLEETSRLQVRAVFFHWRLLVERSRSAYLTERLHDAAYQLENAKNQFQLQCYRADRLVQAAKEATEEKERVSKINDDLQRLVEALKAAQIQREKEYNERLTRNVTQVLNLLSTYDSLARAVLGSKRTGESSMPGETPSAQIPLDGTGTGTGTGEAFDYDEEFLEVNIPSEASSEKASGASWQPLRNWCDGILTKVSDRKTPFSPIRAFRADFANGERYLYVFRHVFPDVVPGVLSINDMDTESRLRRIHEYATNCNLRYRLTPTDFQQGREDLLVCSLSELYQRHLICDSLQKLSKLTADLETFRESDLKATLLACTVSSSTEEVADAPSEQLDEAMVKERIGEYAERLKDLSKEFSTSCTVETELAENGGRIAAQEARLGGERLQRTPIPVVEGASRRAFWELPTGALDDLKGAPKLQSEAKMWDLVVKQALPKLLQEHVDKTSRIFFFFAGESARTLSEVAFWRFVEYSGVLVGRMEVPMQWIATQYDHVVTPYLDGALRVVAHGQSEMSVKKLRHVAYQEMDIRSATPLQFVELLVRLAVSSEKGKHGLVEGTRRLLQELRLPPGDMSSVARELHTPESQHVLNFYGENLLRVYLFYVKRQESSRNTLDVSMATQCGGRFASQMSITVFLTMLEDCRFLSDRMRRGEEFIGAVDDTERPLFFINATQVRKLVSALEKLAKGPANGGLSFNLFLDMLAVLAYHWCPDPLVPEPRRLAAFLSHTVQQLSVRYMDSTLILGSVPTINLEGPRNVDFSYEANVLTTTGS